MKHVVDQEVETLENGQHTQSCTHYFAPTYVVDQDVETVENGEHIQSCTHYFAPSYKLKIVVP